jgi:hypothetical protein
MKLPIPRKKRRKPPVPKRSLVLIIAGAAGLVAAVIAKRAFGGGDEPTPSPDAAPDIDRAGATWAPQPVPPATTPEAPTSGTSATNGGGDEKASPPTDASAHAKPAEGEGTDAPPTPLAAPPEAEEPGDKPA